MRFPRPRLRLRTLLIVVAVAGMMLGGWRMWRRREYCLAKAAECDRIAAYYRRTATDLEPVVAEYLRRGPESVFGRGNDRARKDYEDLLSYDRRAADRYPRLAARYRRVARHPWLPLPREPE
jgi:hypothetical protein